MEGWKDKQRETCQRWRGLCRARSERETHQLALEDGCHTQAAGRSSSPALLTALCAAPASGSWHTPRKLRSQEACWVQGQEDLGRAGRKGKAPHPRTELACTAVERLRSEGPDVHPKTCCGGHHGQSGRGGACFRQPFLLHSSFSAPSRSSKPCRAGSEPRLQARLYFQTYFCMRPQFPHLQNGDNRTLYIADC